jgi:uncharacterized paraquat-inducible protein A
MKPCPNCGKIVNASLTFCPNCGAALKTSEPARLITSSEIGDAVLGVFVAIVSLFLFGIGVLAIPIVWAVMRRTHPAFARGVGIAGLTVLVLLLGAVVVCYGFVVFTMSRQG